MLWCGICRRGNGWKWVSKGKAKGSTSNMIGHMKEKHEPIWNNALRVDLAAWGKELEEQTDENPTPQTLELSVDQPVRTLLTLDIVLFAYYMRFSFRI